MGGFFTARGLLTAELKLFLYFPFSPWECILPVQVAQNTNKVWSHYLWCTLHQCFDFKWYHLCKIQLFRYQLRIQSYLSSPWNLLWASKKLSNLFYRENEPGKGRMACSRTTHQQPEIKNKLFWLPKWTLPIKAIIYCCYRKERRWRK